MLKTALTQSAAQRPYVLRALSVLFVLKVERTKTVL